LTITGALTTNPGGTIATSLAGNSIYGNIVPSGSSNINAGGITLIPTVTGVLTAGTEFTIVNGTSGTDGAPVNVQNTSPLYTFSTVPTALGAVRLVVETVPSAPPVLATPVADAVIGSPAAPGSNLSDVQTAIVTLPSLAAVNDALAQLAPGSTNLAAPWAAWQATRQFEDLWMARLDEIQDLCCETCTPEDASASINTYKCQSSEKRSNWWVKGFGNHGRQGDQDDLNGYRSRAGGLMLAYDMPLNNQTRIGLGAGYANTDIDGNNSSGQTDVDSYQLTGYAHHTSGDAFIQGALMAGVDKYDS
jgi:subtilase-type serine protease